MCRDAKTKTRRKNKEDTVQDSLFWWGLFFKEVIFNRSDRDKDVCKETFCNCYDGDYEVFIEGLPSDRHIHIVLWLSIGLCYHFTQWVTVLIAIVSHMWYKDMASQVLLIISTVITTRRYIQCGCTSSLSVASIPRTPTTTRRLMPRCQHLLIHNSHIPWRLPVLCRSLRPLQSAIYHVTVKTVHDASFLKKLST